jgi:hypothetical protein
MDRPWNFRNSPGISHAFQEYHTHSRGISQTFQTYCSKKRGGLHYQRGSFREETLNAIGIWYLGNFMHSGKFAFIPGI